jgi:hypothetical protein
MKLDICAMRTANNEHCFYRETGECMPEEKKAARIRTLAADTETVFFKINSELFQFLEIGS